MFFYLYAIIELLAIFLDSNVIPTANVSYPVSRRINPIYCPISHLIRQWFAAVYTGLVAAAYACLLINGFVGFQFAEDGTPLSLWVCYPCMLSKVFVPTSCTVPPDSLSRCIRCQFLCRHCHIQRLCQLQLRQASRTVDNLYPLATHLRGNLHRLTTCARIPDA